MQSSLVVGLEMVVIDATCGVGKEDSISDTSLSMDAKPTQSQVNFYSYKV
ncbi:hypothetical protein O9992_21725 [Vibrio lentus]|nr:hypothetical protein [Vibrio lentus]